MPWILHAQPALLLLVSAKSECYVVLNIYGDADYDSDQYINYTADLWFVTNI
jgi:hypothetical protein